MASLLATLLFAILPIPDITLYDTAATLEINHFYDGNGDLVFRQLIAWEYAGRVFFWRMDNSGTLSPVKHDSGWAVQWADKDGQLREVWAVSSIVTHTQWDREKEDRQNLGPNVRRRLKTRLP